MESRREAAPTGIKTKNLNAESMKSFFRLPLAFVALTACVETLSADDRPNILLAIGDDISWKHIGIYGSPFMDTPTFDRLGRQGVVFNNAYCSAPG